MLHTRFKGHRSKSSVEGDYLRFYTIYGHGRHASWPCVLDSLNKSCFWGIVTYEGPGSKDREWPWPNLHTNLHEVVKTTESTRFWAKISKLSMTCCVLAFSQIWPCPKKVKGNPSSSFEQFFGSTWVSDVPYQVSSHQSGRVVQSVIRLTQESEAQGSIPGPAT